ncbi:MAG: hypothetical protein WCQ65_11790, partial [Fermentimonas sp.]
PRTRGFARQPSSLSGTAAGSLSGHVLPVLYFHSRPSRNSAFYQKVLIKGVITTLIKSKVVQ